ncbi:hypothetical protein BRARA_A03642 [Brassica rapa]|uniref:GATA-type domain-containing protein n=1 Tax=Brassica campestris TaxID=3711 RepID=A0A398AVE0_BRACM|nr:hypothetical protein BRARA_A03642 [Brassica rapa]
MLDHTEKIFDSEAMTTKFTSVDATEEISSSSDGGVNSEKKSCAICGTSKTPLWRGGPTGPKSLCNACGIRNKKKKSTVRSEVKKKKKKQSSKIGDSLKQRLMELGREVMMQRKKKLGEEEQAAVLLMALSYASSVYA